MNLGQLLGGAGVVSQGWREAEDAARKSQQLEMQTAELRRLEGLQKQLAGLQMPSFQPVDVAQFTQGFTPGQAMPMGAAPAAAPVALAAPTAPTGGAQPLPAGVRPSTAGAGRGVVNPPLVGQPQPVITPPGTVPITPEQVRQGYNRTALAKAPAAALDVIQAPAAAGLNLISQGARGINYLFGTELPTPQFSMTPFSDRYVTAPEADLAAGVKRVEPTAPAVAPGKGPAVVPGRESAAPAVAPTGAAQKYDAAVTPYDAIIQQSAQQYGIDPVAFKRLIGTESSFSPTAVSPRGEKFGLGIAQIASSHGLTREQRLDPNTAIPFAAQLFSQYLQQSGGNYEQAIQKYKGASSEKGKASMAGPINTILSGLVPSAQAAPVAAPAAPAPMEVPQTQTRNMEMAEFYLAKPESIPFELQQIQQMAQQQAALITRQRNEAAQLAQVYMRSGTGQGIEAAMRLRDSIGQMDASLLQLQQQVVQKQMYLQGMQGIREFATANDPRRLSGVLTQYMGAPVGIQPRPDGKYNYFVNGQKVKDGMTPAELASVALKEFSPEARQAAAASAALENKLAMERKYGPEFTNAIRDIQKAIIDGEYKLAEERTKQQGGKLTIDTSKGVAYFQRGNQVFVIQPDGKIEETPLGKIELPPTARSVAGLNMGR